jgi:hypothetical protein
MNIIPLGDYYAWYCDWCDTRNQTLQQKFTAGTVTCGACHKPFSLPVAAGCPTERYALSGGF